MTTRTQPADGLTGSGAEDRDREGEDSSSLMTAHSKGFPDGF